MNSYPEKHRCLAPEDMHLHTLYTFTFNPKDQPEKDSTVNGFRLNAFKNWMESRLTEFRQLRHCEIDLVPESSSKGRYHFHGYIMLTDIMMFFYKDMPKLQLYGVYEIDTISDQAIWDKYIYKQKHLMEQFCHKMKAEYRLKLPYVNPV